MKISKTASSILIIGSMAFAPTFSFAQTTVDPSTPTDSAPTVKKAKKKNPARPPHKEERTVPSMTKEPPPPPIPEVEPHVPGHSPPAPPGSPPPESM